MRDSIEHFKRNSLKKAETNEKSCLPDPSGESFHLPALKKINDYHMMPGLGVVKPHALKSIVFINLALKTVGKAFRSSLKSPSILHKFASMNSVVAP